VFDVPLRGNILVLAGTCFLFLVGSLCWGIFLSATVRSQLLAYQLGMISSFLPAFLLSGFIFSIPNMPIPVQVVTYIVPARYFINILRGVFLKGVGLEVLVWEIVFLVVFAVVVVMLATRKVRGKVA
jgi:ABC-2 type transport system permease protein